MIIYNSIIGSHGVVTAGGAIDIILTKSVYVYIRDDLLTVNIVSL